MYQNEDRLFTQHIIAQLKNGEEQGKLIHLTNEYSSSGAYDHEYHVGNELFVSIDTEHRRKFTFNWNHKRCKA